MIYDEFNFKFEMSMTGSFFEPQSCNFRKLNIFVGCSNDISTIFWNSLREQTCQKCKEPMCPGNTEVYDLSFAITSERNYILLNAKALVWLSFYPGMHYWNGFLECSEGFFKWLKIFFLKKCQNFVLYFYFMSKIVLE